MCMRKIQISVNIFLGLLELSDGLLTKNLHMDFQVSFVNEILRIHCCYTWNWSASKLSPFKTNGNSWMQTWKIKNETTSSWLRLTGIDRNPKLWRNSMTIVDKIQHTPYTNSDPGWQAQVVQMHSTALLEETSRILWKLIQRRTIAEPFLGHSALAKIDTHHSLWVITFTLKRSDSLT